ncbi:MAG TPA: hypothetical protein DCQ93_00685 [Bacteroidetes bacterium]|nr:hypothetical protein [Bacteroidota bacterium]
MNEEVTSESVFKFRCGYSLGEKSKVKSVPLMRDFGFASKTKLYLKRNTFYIAQNFIHHEIFVLRFGDCDFVF